jgi:hypothetical protein
MQRTVFPPLCDQFPPVILWDAGRSISQQIQTAGPGLGGWCWGAFLANPRYRFSLTRLHTKEVLRFTADPTELSKRISPSEIKRHDRFQ